MALYGYGVLNAVLYASLLPLWEGFDEPFHYASVQSLSRQGRLPALKKTGVSEEIRASLELAPASHVVKKNLPQVTTFEEFFGLPEAERARRAAALAAIPPQLGDRIPRDGTDYEAQQAPLAYLALAPLDRLWAGAPLPRRVWRLRLVCGICAVLLTGWATLALARRLKLAPAFAHAALFLAFSSQMFYGAASHLANDWLAVALMPVLLGASVAYAEVPSSRRAAWMGLALGAGLLAKAYYLALIPLPLALVVWRRRGAVAFLIPVVTLAGPWYLRNWLLYGRLSGLLEAVSSASLWQTAGVALRIPWGTAMWRYAHWALWTGNNSFDTFSHATLDVLLGMLLAAAAGYLATAWKRRPETAEYVLMGGCALFAAVVAYSMAVLYPLFGEEAFSGGPWYAPAVFAPLFLLLARGLERCGKSGRLLLAAMLAGWAYLMAATWWLKLIPLYGGFRGRVRPAELAAWYRGAQNMLDTTALVPGPVPALAAVSVAAALALAFWLGLRLSSCLAR